MLLSTRAKITLVRSVARALFLGRGGLNRSIKVSRRGICWNLDLRQAIDLTIYLVGAFEPGTVHRYKRLLTKGSVAIDIGANIGAHTLFLAKYVGSGGRVLAIEPTQYAYSRLLKNIALNPELSSRISPFQAMLVHDDECPIAPKLYSSWPVQRDRSAHPLHFGVAQSTSGAKVTTLDHIVEQAGVTRVDLIKLDVDGYELEVLRGSSKTLSQFRPVIILECAPYTLIERGDDPLELGAILSQHGYTFCDLRGHEFRYDAKFLGAMPRGSSINILAQARTK